MHYAKAYKLIRYSTSSFASTSADYEIRSIWVKLGREDGKWQGEL